MRRDLLAFLQKNHTAYGDLFRVRFPGRRPTLVALGPAANEMVLNDTQQLFACATATHTRHQLFRDTLLTRDFDDHRDFRALFNEAFTTTAFQGYLERIHSSTQHALTAWPAEGRLKFSPQLNALLLHINANTLMGLELVSSDHLHRTCSTALTTPPLQTNNARKGKPSRQHLRAAETLITLLTDLAPGRRANPGSDMFSGLCQIELPDEAIARNLFSIWHSAQEATALAATHVIYSLARHQDWQERLRDDISGAPKQTNPGGGEQIAFDDLNQLHSIEWVFKEALRLYSPFQTLQRRSVTKVNFAGYQIPENAALTVFPHFTHHLAKWFVQPDQFDPLRFAPDRAEDRRHPFVYVPFGQGPHQCIGRQFALLQVRALLTHLLPRYRLELPPNHKLMVQSLPRPYLKDGLQIDLSAI